MPRSKVTVVLSQSQGKNPAKRELEETIAAELMLDPKIDISVVPHLYDLKGDHTGLLFLKSVPGTLIVLSWLYPRATHWILDRQGVKGRIGTTLLKSDESDEEDTAPTVNERAIGPQGDVPDRSIYCVDLRADESPQPFLVEIQRIVGESSIQTFDLLGSSLGSNGHDSNGHAGHDHHSNGNGKASEPPSDAPTEITSSEGPIDLTGETAKRRWYPVIDYTRCTNCMECIDFCLFGVYGVDQSQTILVEEQDNCKKGCPACSRVCPENAIIFPQHKTPAIAGADGEVANLKIDLSKLFGAPEKDPVELAVAERDVELVRDGRDAVGTSVGLKRRTKTRGSRERDSLDDLMDGLDELEL